MKIVIETGNSKVYFRARVQHLRPQHRGRICRSGGATVLAVAPEKSEAQLTKGPSFFVSKCHPGDIFKKREGITQALMKFLIHLKIDEFLDEIVFSNNLIRVIVK